MKAEIKDNWLNFRIKYVKEAIRGDWNHTYSVVGAKGAIHFWWVENDSGGYGGVEFHHRQPPSYMQDRPPSHADCPYLNSNCWHDGSSTCAREIFEPMHRVGCSDGIFRELIGRYKQEWDNPTESE